MHTPFDLFAMTTSLHPKFMSRDAIRQMYPQLHTDPHPLDLEFLSSARAEQGCVFLRDRFGAAHAATRNVDAAQRLAATARDIMSAFPDAVSVQGSTLIGASGTGAVYRLPFSERRTMRQAYVSVGIFAGQDVDLRVSLWGLLGHVRVRSNRPPREAVASALQTLGNLEHNYMHAGPTVDFARIKKDKLRLFTEALQAPNRLVFIRLLIEDALQHPYRDNIEDNDIALRRALKLPRSIQC